MGVLKGLCADKSSPVLVMQSVPTIEIDLLWISTAYSLKHTSKADLRMN